jgi:hypothetical protein
MKSKNQAGGERGKLKSYFSFIGKFESPASILEFPAKAKKTHKETTLNRVVNG